MKHQQTEYEGVGHQIKEFRRQQHMTLEQLAVKINCSPSYLSRMERGASIPTLDRIGALCEALDCTLNELFGEGESGGRLVRPGDRQVVVSKDEKAKLELLTDCLNANPRMEVGILTLEPGAEPAMKKISSGETVILVLSGEVEVELVDTKYNLKAGDSLHYENTLPHRYYNPSRKSAEAILGVIPPESRFTES
ncbi:MAG: helix-turn-helix transcriptional regulator [Candidatus Hydrogenedentes bacterium]|jgi:transcriptional regulator with XRE-family HTH domain|nr:helix-turn-helix transcriptional regulator [Candidatus Hydrogenedentota bacterium]